MRRVLQVVLLVLRPGPLLALAVIAAVIVVHPSVSGVTSGMCGAALGALAGLAALQLGMLGGAVASGARVHSVVIGIGRRWAEWMTPRRTIVLRGLPIVLSVAVGPGRPPLRLRMWAAALVSALAGLSAVVLLWLSARHPHSGHEEGLWFGAALGASAVVAHALLPRQDATSTSTGWLLVGLPRMPADQVADLRASALVDAAMVALRAGELDAAEAASTELAHRFPGSRAAGTTKVAVLQARGRYGAALTTTLSLAADPELTPRDAAFTFAALASLAAAAVESGEVPADAALPTAHQALEDAVRLGYPAYKLDGTRALLALLGGDVTTAARLARTAADLTDNPLSRADDLATLARAHMAGGDNRAARAALAEATALAPWWPRVAATQSRLAL